MCVYSVGEKSDYYLENDETLMVAYCSRKHSHRETLRDGDHRRLYKDLELKTRSLRMSINLRKILMEPFF